MEAIEESMVVNGFFGSITVREMPDGRYQLIEGEHRWKLMKGAGHGHIPAVIVKMDDVQAARALLASNETAKRSTYDPGELNAVLESIGSLEGTGFVLTDLDHFEDERKRNEPADPGDDDETDFVREYGIVVYVADEAEQEAVYEKLRAEGYRCRVASI